MASPSLERLQERNEAIFDEIVSLLEEGKNEDVLNKLETANEKTIKEIVKAKDRRKKCEIPTFWYRYRPQFREGLTLLHYAMIYGNSKVVEELLNLKADPMVKSTKRSPEFIQRRNSSESKVSVQRRPVFIHRRTNSESKVSIQRRPNSELEVEMFNVIHYPCFLGNISNLEALLKHRELQKDVSVLVNDPYRHVFKSGKKDTWIWTPLHFACGGNNEKILDLLLKVGAEPTNYCVLHYASRMSDVTIVKKLLDSLKEKNNLDNEINKCDLLNMTAIDHACKKRDPEIVDLLLEYGAEPSLNENDGSNTKPSLHYAIESGSQECAKKILSKLNFKSIETLLTHDVMKIIIEKGLTEVLVDIMDKYNPAFRKLNKYKYCTCLIHKVILSDSFSLDDFTKIVLSLGKYCIEEEDEDNENMTPMLLAASRNEHKKLSILFNVYIDLLEKHKFYSNKEHHWNLYRDIVRKRNIHGYAMVHLAVMCSGSDSEFEATVKVFNQIRERLKSLKDLDILMRKDPFLIDCTHGDSSVSAVELALKLKKSERAASIISITKARTVKTKDKGIILSAIENEMSVVDFERMISAILLAFGEDHQLLTKLFNQVNTDHDLQVHPLHSALEGKMFGHVKILLDLKYQDQKPIVNVIINEHHKKSTLHIALVNSTPIIIIKEILKRLERMEVCQFEVPLDEGVQVSAVYEVCETAKKIFEDLVEKNRENSTGLPNFSMIDDVLTNAVKKKRLDVFEYLIVKGEKISTETLKGIVFHRQHEEYAKKAVCYSDPHTLFDKLVEIIEVKDDDENLDNEEKNDAEELDKEDEDNDEKCTTCFHELIKRMPDVAVDVLNQGISQSGGKNPFLLKSETYDSRAQLKMENGNRSVVQIQADNPVLHPLEVMVRLGQEKLLQHPLVTHYLEKNWLTCRFWAYCFKILLFTIFLILFSVLTMTIRRPMDNICTSGLSAHFFWNSSQNGTDFWTISLSVSSIILLASEVIYSLINFILFNMNKMTLSSLKLRCKRVWKNRAFWGYLGDILLQLTIVALSATFLTESIILTSNKECHNKPTWRTGIFAMALAWTYFIILISDLPIIEEFALPFIAICKTFLKLTLFGILLILASTIVLNMIFYNPVAESSPFYTFDGSLIKLITMVTGEIDFQDTFGFSFADNDKPDHEIYDRSMAYFIWVIFLIIIPILLSNTLIALAVGDASEIAQNATIKKLERRVHWVTGKRANTICCKKLSKILKWLSALFKRRDISREKELSDIKFYHMQLKEEKESIKNKYNDESSDGSEGDQIKTVKELAKSNHKRLRDLKTNNDMAFHGLQVGLDHVKKDLKKESLKKESLEQES